MATWMAHLRIAENILKKRYEFEPKAFMVGNIGPDAGIPSEDKSSFNPPKKVTHWLGENKKIDAQSFWNKYLKCRDIKENIQNVYFTTLFININKVPHYLDYFPQGAFEKRVKYITDYYLGENDETKENFIYLTEAELDNFICNAAEKIDVQLNKLLYETALFEL